MVTRCFLQVRFVIGLRAVTRIVDVEGAILYGDANKGVADILEMMLIVRFEAERL